MTALSMRLRLAIRRSTLPDKAIISAIADAEKPKAAHIVTVQSANTYRSEVTGIERVEVQKPKRTYRRRDMRAE